MAIRLKQKIELEVRCHEPWGQMISLSIVVYIENRRGPNTEP